MSANELRLRYLIRKEGANYIATSIDFELVAQARDKEALDTEFCRKFVAVLEGYQHRGMDMLLDHPKAKPELALIYWNDAIPARMDRGECSLLSEPRVQVAQVAQAVAVS